jgi:predicted transcriptional regulator
MANKADPELAIKMTTEIAVAYLSRNSIERREIGPLIRDIRDALGLSGDEVTEAPLPQQTQGTAPTAEASDRPATGTRAQLEHFAT